MNHGLRIKHSPGVFVCKITSLACCIVCLHTTWTQYFNIHHTRGHRKRNFDIYIYLHTSSWFEHTYHLLVRLHIDETPCVNPNIQRVSWIHSQLHFPLQFLSHSAHILRRGGGIVWESDLSWRNERFFDISVQKKVKNVRLLKLKETKRAFTVVWA